MRQQTDPVEIFMVVIMIAAAIAFLAGSLPMLGLVSIAFWVVFGLVWLYSRLTGR